VGQNANSAFRGQPLAIAEGPFLSFRWYEVIMAGVANDECMLGRFTEGQMKTVKLTLKDDRVFGADVGK
jgi:hypothetical protein